MLLNYKAVNKQTDGMLGELQKENTTAVVTSEMYLNCIAVKYIVATSLDVCIQTFCSLKVVRKNIFKSFLGGVNTDEHS